MSDNSVVLPNSLLFLQCSLLAICTNFFEAFSSSYPASSNPAFLAFFNNSYIDRGHSTGISGVVLQWFWTSSLYAAPIGNLLGFGLAPFCAHKYGPKDSILLANIYSLMASLISCGAIAFKFPELLLFGRLIASSASSVGLLSLIIFFQLIVWPIQRAQFSFLCPFSISFVECLALLLNFFCPRFGQNLLLLVGISIPPQLIGIFMALKMPECPQHLMIKFVEEDRQKTGQILEYFRGQMTAKEIDEELDKIVETRANQSWPTIRNLFAQKHRRLAALIGFCVMQMTVGGWHLLEASAGILAQHFGNIFAQQVSSFVLLFGYFLSSLIGLFLIEKIPRRPLILLSASTNLLSLVAFVLLDRLGHSVLSRWLPLLSLPFLLLFVLSLGSCLGPISYFITAELLPLPCPLSSSIISLVFCLNILSSFLFSWATPPLFQLANSWVFLPLYALPSFLCLPLHFLLPETRGREKAEIMKEMEAK